MSARKGFTFEPRGLVLAPKQFGSIRARMEPADGVDAEDPRFRAAQLQHQLANEVREYLGKHQLDVEWFASAAAGHPGVSVDRMRRMLRGETMMQVTDVLLITGIVKTSHSCVQESVGVDLSAQQQQANENFQLRWAMEQCHCPARRKVPAER